MVDKILRCFLICGGVLFSSAYAQQTQIAQPDIKPSGVTNGCGSGWNRPFVPNRVNLARCEFEVACNTHDICYGRCDRSTSNECEYRKCKKGGELFEQQVCFEQPLLTKILEAKNRQESCDSKLQSDITEINPQNPVCWVFSLAFWGAVKGFGGGYFAGADASTTLPTVDAHNRKIIIDFLDLASDDELKTFAVQVQQNKAADFRQPVFYKKGVGITS